MSANMQANWLYANHASSECKGEDHDRHSVAQMFNRAIYNVLSITPYMMERPSSSLRTLLRLTRNFESSDIPDMLYAVLCLCDYRMEPREVLFSTRDTLIDSVGSVDREEADTTATWKFPPVS